MPAIADQDVPVAKTTPVPQWPARPLPAYSDVAVAQRMALDDRLEGEFGAGKYVHDFLTIRLPPYCKRSKFSHPA